MSLLGVLQLSLVRDIILNNYSWLEEMFVNADIVAFHSSTGTKCEASWLFLVRCLKPTDRAIQIYVSDLTSGRSNVLYV